MNYNPPPLAVTEPELTAEERDKKHFIETLQGMTRVDRRQVRKLAKKKLHAAKVEAARKRMREGRD